MVIKWSLNGREIYLFLRFLISGSVRHYHEISTRLPPGEFNNTSNHFQRLSKVSFFVGISGFSRFRHFQNLSPVCTILKKCSGYVRDFVLNTKNYLPNPPTAVHLRLVIKSPGEFIN